MLAALPVPILSVAAEAVRDLQGQDALYSLWTVFTKCKESVQDGRRLENISWRLWYRELTQAQASYQPPTPQSAPPHPKDDRSRSSYFPAPPNEKVSPKPKLLPSGLPSPSDQSSPSPLPPPVSVMVPPSTPERPRISPHTAPSTFGSCSRGKPTVRVGRVIVDMLPNQVSLPQRKSTSPITTTVVVSIPPPTLLPSLSCDPDVPLVQLPASADAPFPRVVVVNPTPHPTPPTTPILHYDTPGAPQPPSTLLSPPLPSPVLRSTVPTTEVRAEQPLSLPPSIIPKQPPLLPTPARIADGGPSTRQSDRQFFLQQSPEDASPERGDGSTASGKSPSDLFEASSAASSQVKSVLTDVDDDKKGDEEEEDDRRSTTAAAGVGARQGRQSKPKRGKEVGKRPPVKRSHSAKHVAPSMLRLSTLQQSQPQPERVANATANTNGNGNANNTNGQSSSRKTIIVATTSSEDYETTDSEGWASEAMDAEDKAREAEETGLREAALEAQRQRELFAKVPKRSYSTLNRTQSGLLSQLMNPNPAIFPLNHPYRISRSSADLSRQYQPQQHHAPVPQRSTSAYAPPRLSTSKSAAALPLAAQITAVSSSKPPSSSAVKRKESEKNGYRPKGPPKEQEMEDDSGDDADDKIQMSQSVAQQKLQALMSRRGSQQGGSSRLIQPVAMEVGPGLMGSKTAPIPLGHPYNLPAAAAPMTPRTTRRRMLKTELSESMRRQLLWERQVSSNTNPALVARRANQGLSGLRPLTSNSSEGIKDAATDQDKDERRRRALARNRSWADDYHYSGW